LQEKKINRLKQNGNVYSANSKRDYKPKMDVTEYVKDCVEWAYNNNWGKGHLKSEGRDKSTKFKNALTGKFGEFGLYRHFINLGYTLPAPDLTIMPEGQWDDGDLFWEGKKISVKTTAHWKNLLLLKKEEWDSNGGYFYGKDGIDYSYKAFFLCRLSPDLESVLEKIKGDDDPGINKIYDLLEQVKFTMDFPGFITINDFRSIISNEIYIPEKGKIGSNEFKKAMYYCQSGDLRDIGIIRRKES
jgi:hypothetical protein